MESRGREGVILQGVVVTLEGIYIGGHTDKILDIIYRYTHTLRRVYVADIIFNLFNLKTLNPISIKS